jgi:Pentapeptide repeats (8 copies)
MRLSPQSLGFAGGDTMTVRHGSWWQEVGKPLALIAAIALLAGVLVLLIFVGYNLTWTGFLHKTLWDWLQLLIIPLVLAVAALLFNRATSRTEQKIASDKQREDLLQAYLDHMEELLLEKQLGTSAPEAVRNIARVRTVTTFSRLDSERKGRVLHFLYESELIMKGNKIVDLSYADLRNANLVQFDKSEADLSRTDLSGAKLQGAKFIGTDLSGAKLQGANLNGADLSRANLNGALGVTAEELEKQAASLTGATLPDGSTHP